MFYSESLLSKDGPLAQVWLAANLERKLNKSQFLQSNIIQSTQAIVKATSSNANTSNNSSSSGSDDSEAIALRLSGQLLYGVVRIYSRKAKYLLDDVSDALLKLKTAFKSSVQSVTLPINATVVPSVTQLMLQDTITHTDLLYQEPLVFDDEPGSGPGSGFFGGSSQGAFANRSTQDFDDSIEIPRNKFNDMDELQEDDGFELDLNFDIAEDDELAANRDTAASAADESIEMGRAIDEGFNLSAIDNIEEGQFDAGFDAGFDDFNFDEERATAADFFDQPLELIDEPTNHATSKETQIEAAAKKIKAPRKQRVSTAGQRKIVVDKDIEIPVSDFSTTDSIVIKNTSRTERFELKNKRSFIQSVLSQNFNFNDKLALSPSKRQKTTATSSSSSSTDDIEHGFDLDLPELDHSGLDHPQHDYQEEEGRYDDVDFGVWGEDDHAAQQQDQAQEHEEEEDDFTNSFGSSKDGISESTLKISRHLQTITSQSDNSKTTFTEILNHDIQSVEPLSSKPRAEATRVFFELLVLSTNDAVKLNQDTLFGEIQIKTRENLFQRFV